MQKNQVTCPEWYSCKVVRCSSAVPTCGQSPPHALRLEISRTRDSVGMGVGWGWRVEGVVMWWALVMVIYFQMILLMSLRWRPCTLLGCLLVIHFLFRWLMFFSFLSLWLTFSRLAIFFLICDLHSARRDNVHWKAVPTNLPSAANFPSLPPFWPLWEKLRRGVLPSLTTGILECLLLS